MPVTWPERLKGREREKKAPFAEGMTAESPEGGIESTKQNQIDFGVWRTIPSEF